MTCNIQPFFRLLAVGVLAVSGVGYAALRAEGDREGLGGGIDDYEIRFETRQKSSRSLGSGTCARCHRSAAGYYREFESAGGQVKREPMDEWDEWYGRGGGVHAMTYQRTLFGLESQQMAKLLGQFDDLGNEAHERADCLACHAFGHNVSTQMRAGGFQIADGIGCEACHGRAEGWLRPHQRLDWPDKAREEWLARGMYETRDLSLWAQKCLECHLGTADKHKRMTHRMMGAGHPPLAFEIATDIEDVPKHWRDSRTQLDGEGSWYQVRLWAVGQAVALRESMRQLLRSGPGAPDFALFNCYACHHEFVFLPSPDRSPAIEKRNRPGEPAWNESPWLVCRHLVRAVLPEATLKEFEERVEDLRTALTLSNTDWQKVHAAAESLEHLADELVMVVKKRSFDRETTRSILVDITGDSENILRVGLLGADQAYRAIETLYIKGFRPKEGDEALMVISQELRGMMYAAREKEIGTNRMWTPPLKRFGREQFRNIMKQLNGIFTTQAHSASHGDDVLSGNSQ